MAFTQMDKALLLASIDTYVYEIRGACMDDQGNPAGEPGTVGNETQKNLRDLRAKVQREIIGY